MCNRAFYKLSDSEKQRKLDIAIRNRTDNLLSAEQIGSMNRNISLKHQYSIAIHPVKQDTFSALVANNILHIFIPEKLYRKVKNNERDNNSRSRLSDL